MSGGRKEKTIPVSDKAAAYGCGQEIKGGRLSRSQEKKRIRSRSGFVMGRTNSLDLGEGGYASLFYPREKEARESMRFRYRNVRCLRRRRRGKGRRVTFLVGKRGNLAAREQQEKKAEEGRIMSA